MQPDLSEDEAYSSELSDEDYNLRDFAEGSSIPSQGRQGYNNYEGQGH